MARKFCLGQFFDTIIFDPEVNKAQVTWDQGLRDVGLNRLDKLSVILSLLQVLHDLEPTDLFSPMHMH